MLSIETKSGPHAFIVEQAVTFQQRARGLMFRKSLAANRGMVFIYPGEVPITMWMKNTFIPLDMVFVGNNGQVVDVYENTTPHSLNTITSAKPARAVVELAAGTVRAIGVKVGDVVRHPVFSDGN